MTRKPKQIKKLSGISVKSKLTAPVSMWLPHWLPQSWSLTAWRAQATAARQELCSHCSALQKPQPEVPSHSLSQCHGLRCGRTWSPIQRKRRLSSHVGCPAIQSSKSSKMCLCPRVFTSSSKHEQRLRISHNKLAELLLINLYLIHMPAFGAMLEFSECGLQFPGQVTTTLCLLYSNTNFSWVLIIHYHRTSQAYIQQIHCWKLVIWTTCLLLITAMKGRSLAPSSRWENWAREGK